MKRPFVLPLAGLAIALAGCARHHVAEVTPPPVVATLPPPPPPAPPVSAINAHLSPAATLWHLRAALNVAALACRGPDQGEAAIVAGYNAMLTTHKAALALAESGLSGEFRAGGGDWRDRYDDAMTRLYNFFSAAPARARFCAAAAEAIAAAPATPDALPAYAAERLPMLDRPFAELLAPAPVLPAAPPAYRAPPVTIAAAAPLPARVMPVAMAPASRVSAPRPDPAPHLQLDLSTLPPD